LKQISFLDSGAGPYRSHLDFERAIKTLRSDFLSVYPLPSNTRGGREMANRRFEMYEIRHVITRMRLGESDREKERAGLMGRRKAGQLRAIAVDQGWLDPSRSLPPNEDL
jgi:hypothetical protein